jgi:hypothetical protein
MSSGTYEHAGDRGGGGRAFRPGPRWTIPAASVAALALGLVLAITIGSGASTAGTPHPIVATYGHVPSWIPDQNAPANPVFTATPQDPALTAIEGESVHAILPNGMAMVTAVGPAVPSWVSAAVQDGRWRDGQPAPVTFYMTFAHAQGTIHFDPRSFEVITASNSIVHPTVTVRGGGKLPATIGPGRPVTLVMKASLEEGQGAIAWAPLGKKVLAGWEFTLELD